MRNRFKPKKEHPGSISGRLPGFIIAGAMKCGTTSLHQILVNHPKIFIPDREIHFYDLDDFIQHPDFFFHRDGEWRYPRFEKRMDEYMDWYASFFEPAGEDQLLGEDSTTYLASEKAMERISLLNPEAKIIIMLRDPASRTYSHYWHLVRTGRAIWNFEDSLRFMQENLVQRSLYKRQVERFLRFKPRKEFLFILFEEFIQRMETEMERVYRFLSVPPRVVSPGKMKTHFNEARLPKSHTLQLWRNRLLRAEAGRVYSNHLIDVHETRGTRKEKAARFVDRLFRAINPQEKKKPPEMKIETRKFLNRYFCRENCGLSEMIGIDIDLHWYKE